MSGSNPFKSRYGEFRVHFFPEAASTNDLARGDEFSHGDMVIADTQTRGRGQRGNSWASAPGENLTFSLILEPTSVPAGRQFLISQAASLALVDTLDHFGLTASVKWPNDIYVGDKKIAGILIENDIMGMNISRSVVGIGLNVNQLVFDPGLPNPVSMGLSAGREFDRGQVLELFCGFLAVRYRQIERSDIGTIKQNYLQRLYLLNVPHDFFLPDSSPLRGTIRDVGPSGELIVESPDGEIKQFLFKEISF